MNFETLDDDFYNYEIFTPNVKRRRINDDQQQSSVNRTNPYVYSIGNEVHFNAPVTKITIEFLILQISTIVNDFYDMNSPDKEYTITYVVDSNGGSVTACFKFIDFLKLIKRKYKNVKFVSIISGMAASAGSIMAVVADERYITSLGSAMIHELSSGNEGRFTQLLSYTDHLVQLHESIVDIYCEKTGMNRENMEKLLKDDKWYNSKEYMEHKFVDKII